MLHPTRCCSGWCAAVVAVSVGIPRRLGVTGCRAAAASGRRLAPPVGAAAGVSSGSSRPCTGTATGAAVAGDRVGRPASRATCGSPSCTAEAARAACTRGLDGLVTPSRAFLFGLASSTVDPISVGLGRLPVGTRPTGVASRTTQAVTAVIT